MRTRCRIAKLAVAGALALLALSAAAAEADVVVGMSIDGIRLGDTQAHVEKLLGTPSSRSGETWYYTKTRVFLGTVSFSSSHHVVGMWTASATQRTSKGIHPSGLGKANGSSLAAVKAAYPTAACTGSSAFMQCTMHSTYGGRAVKTLFTFQGSSELSEIEIDFG